MPCAIPKNNHERTNIPAELPVGISHVTIYQRLYLTQGVHGLTLTNVVYASLQNLSPAGMLHPRATRVCPARTPDVSQKRIFTRN